MALVNTFVIIEPSLLGKRYSKDAKNDRTYQPKCGQADEKAAAKSWLPFPFLFRRFQSHSTP